MSLDIKARWMQIIGPFALVWMGFSAIAQIIFQCIHTLDFASLSRIRDKGFHELFRRAASGMAKYEETVGVPAIVASAHGMVLELGPASGNQLPHFDFTNVKHVFGVEPNKEFEKDLRIKADGLGISEKYTPIMCSLEDVEKLRKFGIDDGSIDCVLSLQVLCSVDDLQNAVKILYRLLKPGGEIIFWEHQRSKDPITRVLQKIWDLPWSLAVGGCHLDKQIEKHLLEDGSWKTVELERDENPYSLKPRIWGRLVKA